MAQSSRVHLPQGYSVDDCLRVLTLPDVPSHLSSEVDLILRSPHTFNKDPNFQANTVDVRPVSEWLSLALPVGLTLRRCFFQIIHAGLHKHVDSDRNVALNFSLDSGGCDSKTQFFDDTDPTTLVHEVHVPERVWYLVRSEVLHAVSGLERPRVAVSAQFIEDDWNHILQCFNLRS